jgi:1,4-alpha-glucan branching enzyme
MGARGASHEQPPFFGAVVGSGSTTFRVWAPGAGRVTLLLENGERSVRPYELTREDDGVFSGQIAGVSAGALYRLSLDDGPAMPDPASRFQPFGVHGPSEVIDPRTYRWRDDGWTGIDVDRSVICELHVGAFTKAGTFEGVAAQIPYLRDLGVTVIELMPVADFAGERNWGYDGVCLFAPARTYGRPDDLRRLVDEAHAGGLAVVLDVVYNHLGPDGAYLYAFAPQYFSSRQASAWGQGVNVDGPESQRVRQFILDNVRHWLAEYHLDGLRLDATHALTDDSPTHIVAEIVETAHAAVNRPTAVFAEDHRNDARMLRDRRQGGWGLDGVWADDFHHIVRRILAGDSEGYYQDFHPSVHDLAATLRQGWFFTGQMSRHQGAPRGTDPAGIHLSPEPRPNRESRVWRPAAPRNRPCRLSRRLRVIAPRSRNPLAVHGPGVGRFSTVRLFHRSCAGTRRADRHRAAAGVREVLALQRSGYARADPQPAGVRDVRTQPAGLGRARARTASWRMAAVPRMPRAALAPLAADRCHAGGSARGLMRRRHAAGAIRLA